MVGDVNDDLRVALARLATLGCLDGYCNLRGPVKGMHTNSGCSCLIGIRDPFLRARLAVVLRAARKVSETLDSDRPTTPSPYDPKKSKRG
jgi:hypothetical protein